MVLRDEPVGGIHDPQWANVVNVAHGVDASDVRGRVTQAPGNGHPAEVGKGLGEIYGRRHRQFEAPNAIVANIALEPRPDVFHDVLMQPVRGPTAGEKNRDVIPRLPGLGVWIPMAFRAQHDRVEKASPRDVPRRGTFLGLSRFTR